MDDEKKIVDLEGLEALARSLKKELANLGAPVSGSVYKPAGNLEAPTKDKLVEENLGKVYNITQPFTANAEDFVDGVEGKFPAGTDVAVVEEDTGVYKFNVLSGFVDLSNYPDKDEVEFKIISVIEANIAEVSEIEKMCEEVFGEGG